MTKKNKTLLFFYVIIAFFATFSAAFAQSPGEQGSSMHVCTRQGTNGDWTCMYDGTPYVFEVNSDGRQRISMIGSCAPLAERLDDNSKCVFCPLFLALFNSVQDMSTLSFGTIAPSIQAMLAIGFAIWIALSVLPIVASFTKQDAPKFLKSLLTQSFKVGLCFYLLGNPEQLYYWLIDPILVASMDFSNSFLFNVDTSQITATFTSAEVNQGYIGTDVAFALNKMISALSRELGFLMAMGSSTLCVGIKSLNISMFINGCFVYVLSLLLLIAFGFYLTDAVIQLAIVGALMPFLIATYPFKITAKFSKDAFGILMNSFFIFLIMGVVISINVTLILQSLVSGNPGGGGDPKAKIFYAFSQNDTETINSFFDIGAAGGLGLIACIILAFKFTEQATQIAEKYSSGGLVKDVGKNIGGLAARAATNLAMKATKPMRQAGANYMKETTSKAMSKTKQHLAKAGAGAKNSKFGQAAIGAATWAANSKVGKGVKKTGIGLNAAGKFVGKEAPEWIAASLVAGAKVTGNGLRNAGGRMATGVGLDKLNNASRGALRLDTSGGGDLQNNIGKTAQNAQETGKNAAETGKNAMKTAQEGAKTVKAVGEGAKDIGQGTVKGAKAGAAAGSVVPVAGTIVGGAIGAAAGAAAGTAQATAKIATQAAKTAAAAAKTAASAAKTAASAAKTATSAAKTVKSGVETAANSAKNAIKPDDEDEESQGENENA